MLNQVKGAEGIELASTVALVPLLSFAADPPPDSVPVDLEQLGADFGLSIIGNAGSGKTHLLRGILEQTHGRAQQIVFDSEGEFWTLRAKFDYLLVARTGGDIPLSVDTATVLCQRVMEFGVSVILDISDLPPAQRIAYVAAFVTQLIETPPAHRRRCLVVIDEVHRFAPEGANPASKQPIADLIALGRKRGFIPIVATQRVAKVDKNTISELQNGLTGRITLDVDAARAASDLGLRGEDKNRLRFLKRGEFFALGPALAPSVTQVRSAQNLTRSPELGAGADVAPPTPAAIAQLLEHFAGLETQAEEDARTLAEAQNQIGELKKRLARSEAGKPASTVEKTDTIDKIDKEEVERRVRAAFEEGRNEGRTLGRADGIREAEARLIPRLQVVFAGLAEAKDTAEILLQQLTEASEATPVPVPKAEAPLPVSDPIVDPVEVPKPAEPNEPERGSPPEEPFVTAKAAPLSAVPAQNPEPKPAPVPRSPVANIPAANLPSGASRILEAFGHREMRLTKAQIGARAGLAWRSSGTFNTYMGAHVREGRLTNDDGTYRITAAGMRAIGRDPDAIQKPQTTAEILAGWQPALKRGSFGMLEMLVAAYPKTLSEEVLAGRMGLTAGAGTVKGYVTELRTNGLIEGTSRALTASSILF